jgi:uncharacterized protein with LGFP repeats
MKTKVKVLLIIFISLVTLITYSHSQEWIQQNSGTWYNIRWISPVNENEVFAGAGDGASLQVLKTINGGSDWDTIYSNDSYDTRGGGQFLNNSIGFMSADNKIMKTINGGHNWTEIYSAPNYFKCLYMVNEYIGFASYGSPGSIIKTSNGTDWEPIYSPPCTVVSMLCRI